MYGATLKVDLAEVATSPEQFDALLRRPAGTTRRWLEYLVPDSQVHKVTTEIQRLRQDKAQV